MSLAFLSPLPIPLHPPPPFRCPHPHHPPRRRTPLPTRCQAASPDTQPPPPPSQISIATAASSHPNLNTALAEATSRALSALSHPPTLAILFVSLRYAVAKVGPSGRHSMDLLVPRLRALVPELQAVIGCTTDGVIGKGPTDHVVELENVPAISLTLARMPDINVRTFHVMPDDMPTLDDPQSKWREIVGNPSRDSGVPAFMLLADSSFAERGDLNTFLSGMQYAYPGASVVGTLASAATAFADGHMFCTLPRDVLSMERTSLRDSGLVGITLTGDVQLDCLISQGVRPIGPMYEVRRVGVHGQLLEMEIVGRPSTNLSAMGCLKTVISYATPQERTLIQNDLHIGISLDQPDTPFLIRNIITTDPSKHCITVNTDVRPGQRVQFYIKEPESARKQLDQTMQKYKRSELANSLVGYSNPPIAALVFVDAGRGGGLFKERAAETRNLSIFAEGVPVAGAFGGGQIGGGAVHQAANLIALIRRRSGMEMVDKVGHEEEDIRK